MPTQCSLNLTWPELHAVIRLPAVRWSLMTHSYHSYAVVWIPIFMLSQHCSIETQNEFVIKWYGVYKIVCATSQCKWLLMTHSLAILALTRTGIDWITPEPSSYLYRSFSLLNLSFLTPNSPPSLILTAYILWFSGLGPLKVKFCTRHCLVERWLCCRILKQQKYHEKRVSFRLVYRIRRFIFIHYRNKLSLNPCNLNCCHSPWHQLYPPSKFCKIL